jgi:hypothetical protein
MAAGGRDQSRISLRQIFGRSAGSPAPAGCMPLQCCVIRESTSSFGLGPWDERVGTHAIHSLVQFLCLSLWGDIDSIAVSRVLHQGVKHAVDVIPLSPNQHSHSTGTLVAGPGFTSGGSCRMTGLHAYRVRLMTQANSR